MPDKLLIQGLAAQCVIGVSEAERASPQSIQIDLEVAIDAAKAAARDDVREAVDYAVLVGAVKQSVEGQPYRLLETLAEDVASLILKRFSVPEVMVRVTKRALPGIEAAAVELTRP